MEYKICTIAKEGTSLAIVHLEGISDCAQKDLSMSRPSGKFQYEVSSASQISPVFHDCLFTPSNITASYEAYSPTIADKSLSLSLCGLVKPSDRCELLCDSFN
ncbi:hypothetical protein V1477_005717 [Vespula maculifrons]|uniref:Uncharacterized protein n=1 Tax=Vespula maculifrons TaxID=7453 RepID=A0ABD2CLU1_VESMC